MRCAMADGVFSPEQEKRIREIVRDELRCQPASQVTVKIPVDIEKLALRVVEVVRRREQLSQQ